MAENILRQIGAHKRAEIDARFDGVAIDALRAQAAATERSLAGVLAKPGSRFILEIKKASPSAGAIRQGADSAALARGYAGVADALSVLADSKYFGGSIGDISAARRAFDGPILAKDFFLDPRQVVEARIAGADAVLVMLSLVDDDLARLLITEARRFGMDALVEVHDEAEMDRARALGAAIVGINNRDLRDLSIDLSTTERLAPLAGDRLVVSESGIGTRSDVERLANKVDAFLVGSALMKQESPALAARELLFGRVKLCGLARAEDVQAGAAASFGGLIFVPGTIRDIGADAAAPLADGMRAAGMLPVGVFRNAPLGTVGDIATLLDLHAVQLHGQEDEDYVGQLRRELGGQCEVWTAVAVGSDAVPARGGDRMLFDSGAGGTGKRFDWDKVRGHPQLGSGLVAGGIGAESAREAAALGAYAIDIGSATEAVPGVKSPDRIAALFDALRPESRKEARQCA